MTREAVIVSTARTPIGKAYRGAFNDTDAPTLASYSIKASIEKAGIDPLSAYWSLLELIICPDTRIAVIFPSVSQLVWFRTSIATVIGLKILTLLLNLNMLICLCWKLQRQYLSAIRLAANSKTNTHYKVSSEQPLPRELVNTTMKLFLFLQRCFLLIKKPSNRVCMM